MYTYCYCYLTLLFPPVLLCQSGDILGVNIQISIFPLSDDQTHRGSVQLLVVTGCRLTVCAPSAALPLAVPHPKQTPLSIPPFTATPPTTHTHTPPIARQPVKGPVQPKVLNISLQDQCFYIATLIFTTGFHSSVCYRFVFIPSNA